MTQQFCVYALFRPDKRNPFHPDEDQPFFIGIVYKGVRINCLYRYHTKIAKKFLLGILPKPNVNRITTVDIISSLWDNNLNFEIKYLADNLSKSQALFIRDKLIRFYGLLRNSTGCLSNVADGRRRKREQERLDRKLNPKKRIFSEQHRKKLSGAQIGEKNHEFGKHYTKEQNKRRGEKEKRLSSGKAGLASRLYLTITVIYCNPMKNAEEVNKIQIFWKSDARIVENGLPLPSFNSSLE